MGDKGAARKTTADMLWVKVWTVPKPGHLAPANMPGTGSRVTLGNLPYRWGLYLGIAYGIGGFKYLFLAIAVFGKGDVSEGIGLFILTILMELAAVLVTVPPKYSDRSAFIEVDRLSFAPLVGRARQHGSR